MRNKIIFCLFSLLSIIGFSQSMQMESYNFGEGKRFNGESGNIKKSTYTILNVCFPISNDKAAMLDFNLDLRGIACSKGSACQSGSSEGSHVLSEIQSDDQKKFPSVRFSFSHNNKIDEVDYLINTLKEFINS